MSDRVQDLTNHRKVAVACKNYTDKEIKASEERILSIVARNNVDFIDHTNEATYRFTAPANAKLLMLQSIAGNSNKIAPSTPSDDSVARLKVIPDNTYKSQIDYIGGKTVKYNQLVLNGNFSDTSLWAVNNGTITVSNNIATFISTAQNGNLNQYLVDNYIDNHKYLAIVQVKLTTATTNVQLYCNGGYGSKYTTATTEWQTLSNIFTGYSNDSKNVQIRDKRSSDWDAIQVRNFMLIDLTLNYGAGNEPSTVETAIPLLKANGYKLDGTDTYSTGKLKHAIVSGVKYSPINLYSGEQNVERTITNSYYTTLKLLDNFKNNTTYTISFYFKQVSGDTNAYYVTFGYGTNGYSSETNQGVITLISGAVNTTTITTNNDTYKNLYIRVPRYSSQFSGTFIIDKIMIVEGSVAPTNFIPYAQPQTLTIPSQVLADARYGLGYDNTNYNHLDSDGHLRGSWAIVDLGSFDYAKSASGLFYTAAPNNAMPSSSTFVAQDDKLLSIYTVIDSSITGPSGATPSPNMVMAYSPNNNALYFNNTSYTTAEAFKTAMSGVYLVYKLAEAFDVDYSQYFDTNWNKVDLDNQYATCEMVVDEPIDMPNKVEYYGTIIHALATAVKQEGVNKFNINEVYSDTTKFTISGNTIKATAPINFNNTKFYFTSDMIGKTYSVSALITANSGGANFRIVANINGIDRNGNYVNTFPNTTTVANITPTSTNDYINFGFSTASSLEISNVILNEGSTALSYRPYKAPITRLLPNSEAKYSWGITDGVRNTRVFCDDECNAVNEGSLVVDNQDLKLLTWSYNTSINGWVNTTLKQTGVFQYNDVTWLSDIWNAHIWTGRDNGDIVCDGERNVFCITTNNIDKPTGDLYYKLLTTSTETLDDFDFSFDCEEGDTFTIIGCELLQCYATYSFLIKEAKSNE